MSETETRPETHTITRIDLPFANVMALVWKFTIAGLIIGGLIGLAVAVLWALLSPTILTP